MKVMEYYLLLEFIDPSCHNVVMTFLLEVERF